MAEGNTSDGFGKSRSALDDVTNRLGKKRGFSEREINKSNKDASKLLRVSPDSCTEINLLKGNVISKIATIPNEIKDPNVVDSKSLVVVETEFGNNGVNGDSLKEENVIMDNSEFNGASKDFKILECSGVDGVSRSVNELNVLDNNLADNCDFKLPNPTNLEADSRSKFDLLNENVIPGIPKIFSQNECPDLKGKDDLILLNLGTGFVSSETNDRSGEIFFGHSSSLVSETFGDMNDSQNDVDDRNADEFILSQSGSIDYPILPDSQESRVFGDEGFTEPKECDKCAFLGGGIDSIKSCSCSFCTQAANIWLDLNSEDIKARTSAIKRSQSEASILAESSFSRKSTEKNSASKLEYQLMHQWRFLFQHMSGKFEQEANQLEASLAPLNDLREKYATDF